MTELYRRTQVAGRKVVTVAAITLMSVFPVLGNTSVAVAATTPEWNLVGTFDITFTCVAACSGDYPHRGTITTQNNSTGDYSGTGYYIPDPSYTWNITGNTMGDSLSYTLVYTGTSAGFTLFGVGTIDEDGNLSGTATGGSYSFTWKSVAGQASEIVGNGVQPSECTGTYTNTIHGTNDANTLKGTSQPDLIFGYGGNDKITGLSGNDCLVGGLGVDTIDGGSADDVIFGQAGADKLSGGTGDDSVYGGNGSDTLNGNAGVDSLTGDADTDTANGGSGIDGCSAETQTSC